MKDLTTYLTPESMVVDVTLEGVLCASGDNNSESTIVDFGYEKGTWE